MRNGALVVFAELLLLVGITSASFEYRRTGSSTLDAAAVAALDRIADRSIAECREYGGDIQEEVGGHSISKPIKGDSHSVEVPFRRPFDRIVAVYHSHGCEEFGYDDENFSHQDTLNTRLPQYLVTPKRRILKFDPVDRKVYEYDRRTGSWYHLGWRNA